MSEFLASRYANLTPYVPGEQPHDRAYVKLNSNEYSGAPSPEVQRALQDPGLFARLGSYADPHCWPLREAVARVHGVEPEQVFVGNGSDEVLGFLLLAFLEPGDAIAFPDVSYGYYRDYAATQGLAAKQVPLREDWTLDVDAFAAFPGTVVFPNPNAPTGLAIGTADIARICAAHPERLVIVDEAYVDYGAQSSVELLPQYRNLVVVHTMSKSYGLAGAHIGWCLAAADVVRDLNDLKFSFNPFNVSAPTMAVGIAALDDQAFLHERVAAVVAERNRTTERLRELGFEVLPSEANFIFARHPHMGSETWCARLREAGVLTRYYAAPRTREWLRVSVGQPDEMQAFLAHTERILGELS